MNPAGRQAGTAPPRLAVCGGAEVGGAFKFRGLWSVRIGGDRRPDDLFFS